MTGWSSARSVIKTRALGKIFQFAKEHQPARDQKNAEKSAGFRFFKVCRVQLHWWQRNHQFLTYHDAG